MMKAEWREESHAHSGEWRKQSGSISQTLLLEYQRIQPNIECSTSHLILTLAALALNIRNSDTALSHVGLLLLFFLSNYNEPLRTAVRPLQPLLCPLQSRYSPFLKGYCAERPLQFINYRPLHLLAFSFAFHMRFLPSAVSLNYNILLLLS